MRTLCRGAAAGVALPAAFLALLALGLPSPYAAALCAAAALAPAACGAPLAGPASLAAAALAALLSACALLPAAGAPAALAAAAALLAASRGAPTTIRRGDAAAAALAAAFAIGLWRCLGYLLGHSLYAAVVVGAGAAAGLAAGRAARARWPAAAEAPPGAGPLAAGLLGLLLLELLRLLGLNAGAAEHIQRPVLGWGEALSLCAQAGAVTAAFAAILAAFELDAPAGSPSAVLAPFAAAAALAPLGGPVVAAGSAALLCALGAKRGFSRWSAHPALSRAVPALLAAALAIGWHVKDTLRDVTFNRLLAVYPGADFALWTESAGRATAVCRFRSGYAALLHDGVADFAGGEPAANVVRALAAARPLSSELLAGFLHPEVFARSRWREGVWTTLYDRRPGCAAILRALAGGTLAAEPETYACGRLRPPAGPFDAIGVLADPPLAQPENALLMTRQSARSWRRRLAPRGVLAWQMPTPPDHPDTQRAAAALRSQFAEVLGAASGTGTLLLASDSLDRKKLEGGGDWLRWTPQPAGGAAAASAERPLAALPARLWPR